MAEAEKGKTKSGFFTRKRLVTMAVSIVVSTIVGWLADIAFHSKEREELASLQASAYATIAQFAPWNFVERYVQIVITQDPSGAKLAHQQFESIGTLRDLTCGMRQNPMLSAISDGVSCAPPPRPPHGLAAFYLSAHVPIFLRPVTAFFDILLHALLDQGAMGFLVAAVQIGIGIALTRFLMSRGDLKIESFYGYIIGVPLAVLALGSIAALPLWVLAFIGVTVFKGLPGAGIGVQAGGTAAIASWVGSKAVEEVSHEAIMKQAERVIGE